MQIRNVVITGLLSFAVVGCEVHQVMRPLRLYDLGDGKIIEVFLRRNSQNSGKLVSARVQAEKFEGEIVLYGASDNYRPSSGLYNKSQGLHSGSEAISENANLAELYGFGKETNARPAGTAILVGDQGTTIEIVLYRLSADLQYGDGVARDNKGRRYRVFLSTEG